MSLNPRLVKESFAHIEPFAEKAAAYFYGRLFAENPRLRALFPPAMDAQRDRLFHALTKIVWSLDSPDALATYLGRLGQDHRKFGVVGEHYAAVGQALIATIRAFSGDAWTGEVEAAWLAAYEAAAGLMIRSADESATTAPPWWIAEVLEHERRTGDIATLTVRPGQRLGYTAGQYVTVQTARWPRVWRPYSIANAPREDGVLRFHVRALRAGWVSGSLVRDTKVGDTLLLGPAMGGMALDPDSDRDLLLVAGGTGLAPLKAIAEQVIMTGRHRNVHLIVGARTERELYDLPDLRLLESTYPWLYVVPVVSEETTFDGMQGTVPEALARFHDWDDRDVYVAGPAAMIIQTVQRLQGLGVPPTRIHHDPLDPGRAGMAG
ncbi:MAG: 2-polyprenylphenol hydroxylase and related flavodoxin oxidoreductase-like protein [Streptosporangiaceae bacterium]|jgi:NAD(P)H-flavin reductase/hemoglobin-like flavoprotein|nr:2-polyprenylphenol hydroxylase and related flavodoxin oxidoreductase-like protein [Streptosporangiaceae bacterium]